MDYQELLWEISQCKENLKATDYEAIKYSEGVLSESEYAPIKTQRMEWRARINELENQLPSAKTEWESRED